MWPGSRMQALIVPFQPILVAQGILAPSPGRRAEQSLLPEEADQNAQYDCQSARGSAVLSGD